MIPHMMDRLDKISDNLGAIKWTVIGAAAMYLVHTYGIVDTLRILF